MPVQCTLTQFSSLNTHSLSVLSKEWALPDENSSLRKMSFSMYHIASPVSVSFVHFKPMFYSLFDVELITVQEHRTKFVWSLTQHVKTHEILEKSTFSEPRVFQHFMSSQVRRSSIRAYNHSMDGPFCALSNGMWTVFPERVLEKVLIWHWPRPKMHGFLQTSKLFGLDLLEGALGKRVIFWSSRFL